MIRIDRILCPTDFSELADHATDYACALADAFKAELHVLHVVDESYQYWMAMGPNSLPLGPTPEEIRVGAEEQMERCKRERFSNAQSPLVATVRVGRPFLEIIRYARDQQIGLIVMGTHGRSGLTHVLLGSVTEKVVRKAPCPVLTVRAPGHKFEMP
jgi:universal stress protein A